MKKQKQYFLFFLILSIWISIVVLYTIYKNLNLTYSEQSLNYFVLKNFSNFDEIIQEHECPVPWYFKNGKTYPEKQNNINLMKLYGNPNVRSDRIIDYLNYYSTNNKNTKKRQPYKVIYIVNKRIHFDVADGGTIFSKCPVRTCKISKHLKKNCTIDLLIYRDGYLELNKKRTNVYNAIRLLYILESPYALNGMNNIPPHFFNWTATYRFDSDIVAPYGKWAYYNISENQKEQTMNFAANKTKKVAWMVSNCLASNNRLEYARILGKYIQVDIYGRCGSYSCSRKDASRCSYHLSKHYKFYLAFENSNCKDYITEKFFINSLKYNMIPIVMGASPEEYERIAPRNSYIHVGNFQTVQDLANYLNYLDQNDNAYNSYFKWKGTGEFIDTFFWCRLCGLLNDENLHKFPKSYKNIKEWWVGKKSVCRRNYRL